MIEDFVYFIINQIEFKFSVNFLLNLLRSKCQKKLFIMINEEFIKLIALNRD